MYYIILPCIAHQDPLSTVKPQVGEIWPHLVLPIDGSGVRRELSAFKPLGNGPTVLCGVGHIA